jgi:hypothetical protein
MLRAPAVCFRKTCPEMTRSMAPTEKARPQGNNASLRLTAAAPTSPPTGSTIPVTGAKGDADTHPFRKGVEGEPDDEQPLAAQRHGTPSLRPLDEMLMWHFRRDQPDGECTENRTGTESPSGDI